MQHDHENPDSGEIPELDEVVTPPASSPPPNFDLFADSGLDRDTLRELLVERLGEEFDAAFAELRAEFEELLRLRVEARLRDRLPEIIDAILPGQTPPSD